MLFCYPSKSTESHHETRCCIADLTPAEDIKLNWVLLDLLLKYTNIGSFKENTSKEKQKIQLFSLYYP